LQLDGTVETIEVEQRNAFFNEIDYFIGCIKNDKFVIKQHLNTPEQLFSFTCANKVS